MLPARQEYTKRCTQLKVLPEERMSRELSSVARAPVTADNPAAKDLERYLERYHIGQKLVHPNRGLGQIVQLTPNVEKFCTVKFDGGERHSYNHKSMKEFTQWHSQTTARQWEQARGTWIGVVHAVSMRTVNCSCNTHCNLHLSKTEQSAQQSLQHQCRFQVGPPVIAAGSGNS